ncbi:MULTISPECIES: succinyldiaminopimelate transaminase [unclassified Anaeromyxobacter]|uniref:succinyldiaminopimelate transaminase n=1 Tax=unclassified Anaeromyxobacter TaxID=2620896 RepID=UPI001F56DAF5|nr:MULTISPECIES: succinyldiaminopimelate transaminase [unclassified Anaeromyxobacter]
MQNAPKNPALGAVRKNLMVELDERRRALTRAGKRLFDFGLGDPKEPTPPFLREALRAAVPQVSQYPSAFGTPALRRAAAGYLARRFGVTVDPEAQVLACAGAKEAIFHLPLAFAGDPARCKVVMPDPGYPTYEVGARFAGLDPVKVPLTAARRFLLEPEDVGEAVLRETLVFWISYPHNPTGAVAPRDYLRRVGEAARRFGFVVASDECYADVYFGAPPPSMLEEQVENVVAIHSCSKRSGMTGYRSGFLAGDADLIAVLRALRSHPGVASPEFVAAAATAAWSDDAHAAERREIFRRKRDRFLAFFAEHGLLADASEATLYLWVRVPGAETAASYALRLLDEGIVVAPGPAFGAGEGYVRVALVPTLEECEEAILAWRKVRA